MENLRKYLNSIFLKIFSNLNAGAPIGIPNAFASLLLDITQPSLFDNTTTFFFQDLD